MSYDRALIDGILSVNIEGKETKTVVDGDAKYLSIAAASIIAKVAHDEFVIAWCEEHNTHAERYDLISCMGYGTAKHRSGIKEYGLIEGHRHLFMKNTHPSATIVTSSCLIQDDLGDSK